MNRRIVAAGFLATLLLVTKIPAADAFSGKRLINAAGAVHETAAKEEGSIALSGAIDFNKSGGATAVHITIALVDTGGDSISCVLSNPSDVTYTLADNVGTLTLKVGAGDVCTTGNLGNTIVFNMALLSNTGRITATSINLTDSGGDAVDLTTADGAILTQ